MFRCEVRNLNLRRHNGCLWEEILPQRPTSRYRSSYLRKVDSDHDKSKKVGGIKLDEMICRGEFQHGLNTDLNCKQFYNRGYRMVINKAKDVMEDDFLKFQKRIREETTVDDPIIHAVCNHYISNRGKQFRPILVLLISRILNEITISSGKSPAVRDPITCDDQNISSRILSRAALHNQIEIATISELIHVSSIMHDDVIDGASFRRMIASTNYKFGNKLSILGGDLLFSRASTCLSRIGSCEVVGIISSIIQSLVEGEILQIQSASGLNDLIGIHERMFNVDKVKFSEDPRLDAIFNIYLERLYLKTASLLYKSVLAATVISGSPPDITEASLSYSKNVGLAFQMYDDISDFDSLVLNVGKPVGSDLKNGLATLPVLFAAKSNKKLLTFVSRGFTEPNDVDMTIEIINSTDSIQQSKQFSLQYCERARNAINSFPNIPETEVLREFTYAIQHP